MSAPRYRVELSADELADIRQLFDRDIPATPIRARAPKTAADGVELFAPNTGDPALDEFMRRSRACTGAPKPPRATPAPKFPYGLKPMTAIQKRDHAAFNDAALTAWQRLGYTVDVERLPGDDYPRAAADWRNVTLTPPANAERVAS